MISLEFDNNPKRLKDKFARPFRAWAATHHAVIVDYYTEPDLLTGTEVLNLQLRSSYERQRFGVIKDPFVTFYFEKNGNCVMDIDGNTRRMRTWQRGARVALAFAHEMGRRDVERARKLNTGLKELRRVLNAPKKK